MKRLVPCLLFLATLSLFSYVSAAYAAKYHFTTLDFSGATGTLASDINDAGQIVGFYYESAEVWHGFLLSGGDYTPINVPFPGVINTQAVNINEVGQIVGSYEDGTGWHGFLLSGGVYTPINGPLTPSYTYAQGINKTAQIVGTLAVPGTTYGFIRDPVTQVFTIKYPPGGLPAQACDVNDAGQIVGLYSSAGGNRGWLLSGEVYTYIDVPDASDTNAYGINNNDQIVGGYWDGSKWHGFLATPIHPILPSIMLLLE